MTTDQQIPEVPRAAVLDGSPIPAAEIVSTASVRPNAANPRIIKDEAFAKLTASIRSAPWMLRLRPVIARRRDGVILAGNQRYAAAIAAGLKVVPVLYVDGLTEEQEAELTIRDNVAAGTWDFAALLDSSTWDAAALADFGVDLPFTPEMSPTLAPGEVTAEDVAAAADSARDVAGAPRATRDVTCPHCGKDFAVAADAV